MDIPVVRAPWRWTGWIPAIILAAVVFALTVGIETDWSKTNAHPMQIVILCFGYIVLALVLVATISTRKHHKQ